MKAALIKLVRAINAAQLAVFSFMALILAGAFLLMTPAASHGEPLNFMDALFTSTSATCVTGLIVVETGEKFTAFGQAVILFLIQLGGFGVMTLSTLLLFVMGRRASLKLQEAAGGAFLKLRRYSLAQMLSWALLFTVICEFLGFSVFLWRMWGAMPMGEAFWSALFHSISGFCNAGFSLYPDSLTRFREDMVVNYSTMALIVAGGIGFFVVLDLKDYLAWNANPAKRRLSFHTKLVLATSAALIVAGALIIYGIERGHNLAGMSGGQAVTAALFQSVTARTAGFNTLPIGELANASLFMLILLMFVGGAPGSMAGGVKVTTLAIIVIVVISRFRRQLTPSAFGRAIARENLERALALLVLSGTLIVFTVMALLASELGGQPHPESRGLFMELIFEVVSAFSTVGLSTGVTPGLTPLGKFIITLSMFIGRLGPMTLVFALASSRPSASYRFPSEQIMVG